MLAFNNKIAEETLRLLAEYQTDETSTWQDSQPGKILHELRVGELAHLHEIPHTPYYGSVDATELFLILISRVSAWTGSLDLFHALQPNIEAALNWIDRYGDSDGDGYVDYSSDTHHGLVNQGWKDSGDAIVNADGSLATPPIAMPEVQGYVYRAKLGMAGLYEKAGDASRADELRKQAADLRARFNRDFWSEKLGTYVLALQAGGRPAEVAASNAGQVLWTGIADPDKAHKTAARLMKPDMFNGWGIRTLSEEANRYNPISYHLGTVWPFDNALIAAGFRRYGEDDAAVRLFLSMMEAAVTFEEYRLPELFAGFGRAQYKVPVHYPVACHPQAWSAGSTPYLLTAILGLVPDAFEQRLSIVRPRLPAQVGPIELHHLVVGDARVDLSFDPVEDGPARVRVQKVEGKLDVNVVSDPGDYDF
jgi:glycogen debranching enzyme